MCVGEFIAVLRCSICVHPFACVLYTANYVHHLNPYLRLAEDRQVHQVGVGHTGVSMRVPRCSLAVSPPFALHMPWCCSAACVHASSSYPRPCPPLSLAGEEYCAGGWLPRGTGVHPRLPHQPAPKHSGAGREHQRGGCRAVPTRLTDSLTTDALMHTSVVKTFWIPGSA